VNQRSGFFKHSAEHPNIVSTDGDVSRMIRKRQERLDDGKSANMGFSL
jgi:hypothetical protein